jgi:hypothetical protein
MQDDAVVKVMGVMTKMWDYQPAQAGESEWAQHAAWLTNAIRRQRPRAEMDAYMSRVQMRMRLRRSMAFRKIVDRSIELLAAPPDSVTKNRIERLNPTAA